MTVSLRQTNRLMRSHAPYVSRDKPNPRHMCEPLGGTEGTDQNSGF